jgi:hypothetical protein
METNLPRRRFLVSGALAAGAFLVPGVHGASRAATNGPSAMRLNDDDRWIESELATYSVDVHPWAGPVDFDPPKRKTDPEVTRSTNFLVRVSDVDRLVRYLTSRDLERLGVVYASGPHLAFFAGTTAYIVTNYGPEDFFKATQ